MRIGYVQFDPALGDLEANRREVARLVREAPESDLLVLPELANSGYHFPNRDQAALAAEPAEGGAFVELLTTLARERGLILVAGLCERAGERLYNSAVVVGEEGLLGLYRKLHLFLDEQDLFTPGDLGLPLVEVEGVRLGTLICFDWRFPEVWRVLALRGADIICHPSNLVVPGRCQRAVPVHALLNRVYVVTANRIGEERGLAFTGCSLIADPEGEILAEAPADSPDVQVVEIDLERARRKAATPRNDLFGDRRPEWYAALVEADPPVEPR